MCEAARMTKDVKFRVPHSRGEMLCEDQELETLLEGRGPDQLSTTSTEERAKMVLGKYRRFLVEEGKGRTHLMLAVGQVVYRALLFPTPVKELDKDEKDEALNNIGVVVDLWRGMSDPEKGIVIDELRQALNSKAELFTHNQPVANSFRQISKRWDKLVNFLNAPKREFQEDINE